MTPEIVTAMDPQPQQMGEFARLTGVFFEPKKAFSDIGQRPKWLVPVLLSIVASLAFFTLYGQHVGWERFLRHQLEVSPKAAERMNQIPAEKREESIAMQGKFIGIGYYVGSVVGTPLMYLMSAAVLLGMCGMMSAGLKFKQVFAIVAYASLPGILKQGLSAVVMFLKNPDDFNLQNPLAFNPGAFMDPINSSKFLYTIATSLDLFAFWVIFLTATGLSVAAGKRLSFSGALTAVLVPYVLLVLLGASMAAMFN